jgi:hypothetical protein
VDDALAIGQQRFEPASGRLRLHRDKEKGPALMLTRAKAAPKVPQTPS